MKLSNQPTAERVPGGSQALVIPFMSAIGGILAASNVSTFRTTMHRTFLRQGIIHLQQLVDYVASDQKDETGYGRLLPVTSGIIGGAYNREKIFRTKQYLDEVSFETDLKSDMGTVQDDRSIKITKRSYLAIPIYGNAGKAEKAESQASEMESTVEIPCLILYAEADFNTFSNNDLMNSILSMCNVFCKEIDKISERSNFGLKNFPLDIANSKEERKDLDMYPTIHEPYLGTPPRFDKIGSFNFDFVA